MPASAFTASRTLAVDPAQPAARGGQGPLPADVSLHLDAGARRRRGEARARRLLVEIAGLELEQVHFLPRQPEEPGRGVGVEGAPLVDGDFAGRVAHVVADHAPDQGGGCRAGSPEGDRLHLSPFRTFSLMGSPVALRCTSSTSAMMLSAISGADWAPRSRPMGTRTRDRAPRPRRPRAGG